MAAINYAVALVCLLDISFAVGSPAVKKVSPSRSSFGEIYEPGDLIFADEFDYLNPAIWKHEVNMNGGGNNEFQIYDNYVQNTFVKDGVLYLKPTLTSGRFGQDFLFNGNLRLVNCTDDFGCATCCGKQASGSDIIPPVLSGRIRTKGAFSFTYGRVEIRAQIPSGDWTWPALWLLPEDSKYGGWPTSGEIDVMESVGNRNYFIDGKNVGSEKVGSTLHFGPNGEFGYSNWWAAHYEINSPPGVGYDRNFHLYGIEWTPEHFIYYVDGQEIGRTVPGPGGFFELGEFDPDFYDNFWKDGDNLVMAPFDQNFHFVLNTAIGGNFFPDNAVGDYPRPWPPGSRQALLDFWNGRENWFPSWQGDEAAMKIDYIRVYAV